MAYQLLGKLYYGEETVYKQAYRDRFASEDAVKLDFLISGNQAFFLQNTEVLKLAYDIVKLDKSVSKLSQALPGVAKDQYSRRCLIDEIVLTNRIEGVHSSRKEISEALDILGRQSLKKGKQHRFIGLVNKYLKLLTEEQIPLATCQDIRDLYDEIFLHEVLAEDPQNAPDGVIFRKDMTAVHSETDKVIHKGLYPESEIIDAMEKALGFLSDKAVDRLCRICVFHYLVEYIHPFYDGNGRLGRFILSYCLSETLEPLLAYRISEIIKENMKEYYKAFRVCNDPHNLGDLTPFLLMMLGMIHMALQELEKALSQKLIRWQRYEKLVSSFPETAEPEIRKMYSYLIQAGLFSETGISTAELERELQGSYYIVKKLLGQVRKELLVCNSKGKEKCYQLDVEQLDKLLMA